MCYEDNKHKYLDFTNQLHLVKTTQNIKVGVHYSI